MMNKFEAFPIETAPKDQVVMLGAEGVGWWIGYYCERYISGYRPENPWQSLMLNVRYLGRSGTEVPTHWAPLPEAPK